jgi:hypothetical protein
MGCNGKSRLVHVAVLCTAALACGGETLGTSTSDGGTDSSLSDADSGGSDSGVVPDSGDSGIVAVDSGDSGTGDGADGSSDSSSVACFAADDDGGGDGGCSCFGADSGGDGGATYQCKQVWHVDQLTCFSAWPPNYPGFIDFMDGGTFSMKIAGNCVEVFGSFICGGTWSGNGYGQPGFTCTITGVINSTPCPGVLWSMQTSGSFDGQPLLPGQIGASTPGFEALCQ